MCMHSCKCKYSRQSHLFSLRTDVRTVSQKRPLHVALGKKRHSWSALRDGKVLLGCYGAYMPAEHPQIHLHLSARSSCVTSYPSFVWSTVLTTASSILLSVLVMRSTLLMRWQAHISESICWSSPSSPYRLLFI